MMINLMLIHLFFQHIEDRMTKTFILNSVIELIWERYVGYFILIYLEGLCTNRKNNKFIVLSKKEEK